jgi:hypothetical protein
LLIYFPWSRKLFLLKIQNSGTSRRAVGLWSQLQFVTSQAIRIFSNTAVRISDLTYFYLNIYPWCYLLRSTLDVITDHFVYRPICVWTKLPQMIELTTKYCLALSLLIRKYAWNHFCVCIKNKCILYKYRSHPHTHTHTPTHTHTHVPFYRSAQYCSKSFSGRRSYWLSALSVSHASPVNGHQSGAKDLTSWRVVSRGDGHRPPC